MKIAAISEDGTTVSQHFGRAPYYIVLTIEGGEVVGRETRPKAGHHTFAATERPLAPGERHGYDAGSQAKHATMAESIADCQVLIHNGSVHNGHFPTGKGHHAPTQFDMQIINRRAPNFTFDIFPLEGRKLVTGFFRDTDKVGFAVA